MNVCARARHGAASTPGEGASGGNEPHTARSDVHADAKATRESDGVLFTRRVTETRRPIDLHERPIKVVRCTSANGRRQQGNAYSLGSSDYSRFRARQTF